MSGTSEAGRFRIAAAASGDVTEKYASGATHVDSGAANASAPPEPPSPITSVVTGTDAVATATNNPAIAPPAPACSAAASFAAPGVSTSVSTGIPSRDASSTSRAAVRKPDGDVGVPHCAAYAIVR